MGTNGNINKNYKTIVLGDTHGRTLWKLIVSQEKPDRLIFIGDYFDSFDIKGLDQITNFLDIIEYKKSNQCEVIMLIGNHDHHYFPEIGYTGTIGYQKIFAPSIQIIIEENRNYLQMAYKMGEFLFTHAGVSSVFMDNAFGKTGWTEETIEADLNELFKYKPGMFKFGMVANLHKISYLDPYGDNMEQSPIWIRPSSLMRANRNTLRKKLIQVVGHTSQEQIDIKGKATGGRYYFIDTLGTSGQYMIINNNKILFNKI